LYLLNPSSVTPCRTNTWVQCLKQLMMAEVSCYYKKLQLTQADTHNSGPNFHTHTSTDVTINVTLVQIYAYFPHTFSLFCQINHHHPFKVAVDVKKSQIICSHLDKKRHVCQSSMKFYCKTD
jgi:hypothetical protein